MQIVLVFLFWFVFSYFYSLRIIGPHISARARARIIISFLQVINELREREMGSTGLTAPAPAAADHGKGRDIYFYWMLLAEAAKRDVVRRRNSPPPLPLFRSSRL